VVTLFTGKFSTQKAKSDLYLLHLVRA